MPAAKTLKMTAKRKDLNKIIKKAFFEIIPVRNDKTKPHAAKPPMAF